MAIIESSSGTQMSVDAGFGAARVSLRPAEVLGWYSVGARSGALTGSAAGTALFSLRNLSANPLIVRRLGIGFIATTGFTAAQELAFALCVARAFTASDSGGAAIALTGNTGKHRTSLGTPTSVDCRIATTAALTAGTKTLDVSDLSVVNAYAAASGAGTLITPQLGNLLSHDAGDYPLVLAQNEGLNIMNRVAMGAGGVGTLAVNIELAEATSF